MQYYVEKYNNIKRKIIYTIIKNIKNRLHYHPMENKYCFGYIGNEEATAACLKAKALIKIFGNEYMQNAITYVCSGNIPYKYCLAEKELGIKIIVNQNGVFYPAWYEKNYREANERNLLGQYKSADYIIYQSKFCEQSARLFLGDPKCPSEVLYNPIDTEQFVPEISRKYDMCAPRYLATGNFYNHAKKERLTLIFDAFKIVRSNIPGATMIIAGKISNSLRETVECARQMAGVTILPAYQHQNAAQIYRSADIYLNTQFNDACPSAVLEAMSCGLPVVHLDCGGTPELTGDTGIAVPVYQSYEKYNYPTIEQYAGAMMEAMRMHSELSKAARQRCVERFNLHLWKKRHEEIFKMVCE
jgi:glycosyltransferase involved in cell wall biosynthesis